VISTRLVLIAIAVEAVALLVGLALLAGHGAWFAARERLLRPRLSAARAGIVAGLTEGSSDELSLALLDGLPFGARLGLLGDLEPSVAGAQRGALLELARRAGILDRASRLCHSQWWKRRLRGARIHTLLGGGEEDMPRLFNDLHAPVRAEAAAWAAEHPQREVIARLIALLGDDATLCRFTVKDSLLRLGPAAVEPIAEYLATASGARAAAGLEVAAALGDSRLLEAGFRLLGDEHPATRCRAAELLGALGGEDAVAAMIASLADPAADVRAAAARALGEGHHWTAAPPLAAALRDASWEVRSAAGLALRQLGAPGELLLQRMVGDDDRFAGDMARLILSRPNSPA
jgi:hypothetical protein